MAKVKWDGGDALCPRCGRRMKPADLIRGLSFLEERVFICMECGPVFDGVDTKQQGSLAA
jgi:DNA-directed RNA polymerase subunit RPC12/RpoP